MKKFLIIILLLTPLILVLIPSKKQDIYLLPPKNEKPDVYVFTMISCPYCQSFKREFLPKLKQQFKGKVNFYDFVLSDQKGMQLYSSATSQCNKRGVPLLVVGNKCVNGYPGDIKYHSIQAINDTLKEKGFEAVPTPNTNKQTATNTKPTQKSNLINNGKPTIYVWLSPTCPYCKRFKSELYPQLKRMYGDKVNFYEPSNIVYPGSEEERFFKNKAKYCKGRTGVPLILAGSHCVIGYSAAKRTEIFDAIDKFLNEREIQTGKLKVYS